MARRRTYKGCSLRCGSAPLCGRGGCSSVPVRVHITLLLVPALVCLAGALGQSGVGKIMVDLLYSTVGLYGTVLVHELGHLSAAHFVGCDPDHVLLWPFGGLAVIANGAPSNLQRAAIAAAGPLMHVPMALVWIALFASTGCGYSYGVISYRAGDPVLTATFFAQMIELNISLLLFNGLLPVVPLDASTVLVSVGLHFGGSPRRIAQLCLGLSYLGLAALAAQWCSFLTLSGFSSFSPLTLLAMLWLVHKTRGLHGAYAKGTLERHALFKSQPTAHPMLTNSATGASGLIASTEPAARRGWFPWSGPSGGAGADAAAAEADAAAERRRAANPFFGGAGASSCTCAESAPAGGAQPQANPFASAAAGGRQDNPFAAREVESHVCLAPLGAALAALVVLLVDRPLVEIR